MEQYNTNGWMWEQRKLLERKQGVRLNDGPDIKLFI